jgi:hypothetical protein
MRNGRLEGRDTLHNIMIPDILVGGMRTMA